MQSNRKSDVTVKVLGFDQFKADAITALSKKAEGGAKVVDATFGNQLGYVETPEGIFVLDGDGVGTEGPLGGEADVNVGVYGTYNCDGQVTSDVFPPISFKVNASNIKNFPVVKEVNLAEFIRCFGSRLEENFTMWNDKFNQVRSNK